MFCATISKKSKKVTLFHTHHQKYFNIKVTFKSMRISIKTDSIEMWIVTQNQLDQLV